EESRGTLFSNLTIGIDITSVQPLRANSEISDRGMMLFGSGFIVTYDEAVRLGLGRVSGIERHVRPYRNGRDITRSPRGVLVIDLFGLTPDYVRDQFPEVYQHVLLRVKSERDHNRDTAIRENWWLFGRPRPRLREALNGLSRYIVTVETSKHRFFQFLDISILPDNKLVAIASEDPFHLGVLSSGIHVTWALASGGNLGVGNDPVYVKTRCFETFPFPEATEEQQDRIRTIAESLDAHRARQLDQHERKSDV